jgi:hypothetical protein
MKTKTKLKAGALVANHNETLVTGLPRNEYYFKRNATAAAWKRPLSRIGLLFGVCCIGSMTMQASTTEYDLVYMLGLDGSIRQMTCVRGSCGPLWNQIDVQSTGTYASPTLFSSPIVTGAGFEGAVGSGLLFTTSGFYQLHHNPSNGDFSMWQQTGSGWTFLDNNSHTKSLASGVLTGVPFLFQLHTTGAIWMYTGQPCNSTGCPGWQLLDNNSATKEIIAAGGAQVGSSRIPPVVQLHSDGSIWLYTGTPCNSGGCPGWIELDNNPTAVAITGFADNGMGANSIFPNGSLFQLHNDGSIWSYTGTPCNAGHCPGWKQLDFDPSVTAIVAAPASANGRLYKLRNDGSIWELHSPFNWVQRDSRKAIAIAASGNALVQLDQGGSIQLNYDLSDCITCGWQSLNNPFAVAIAVTSIGFVQ